MPEDSLDIRIVLEDNLLKTKKEHKNLKKSEILGAFIKTNYTQSAFSFQSLM